MRGKPDVIVVNENQNLQIPIVSAWQQPEDLIPVLKSDASRQEKCDACRQLAASGGKDVVPLLVDLSG